MQHGRILRNWIGRLAWIVAIVNGFAGVARCEEKAPAAKVDPEQEAFFEKRIRPMLVTNCVSCHGPEAQEGGLRLDARDFFMKGMDGHPVAVAGQPDKSRLIEVTRYDGSVQMPPDGKLSNDDFDALVKWVRMGLPWPQHGEPEPATAAPSADPTVRYPEVRATHWAFQPIRHAQPPKVANTDWAKTPIDQFILATLEEHGLTPSAAADRRTLLRRVTVDLTGLPPTPEEMEAFVADKSSDAYRKVVERLLASPSYGERWGRHWLDIARYADTKGYVFTDERRYPYAYTYRDYVVRAFNDDLPFNQFVLEQLAADQLPQTQGENGDKRRLAAMGFLTVGRRFGNNATEIIDDRIDVVTRGLMGLTVGCARCHDHKYDPIPTADYYSLYGVFASSNEPEDLPEIGKPEDENAYREYLDELAQRQQKVADYRAKELTDLQEELRTHVGDYLAQVLIDKSKKKGKDDAEGFDYSYDFAQGEPRPPIVKRWGEFLSRHSRVTDPVFSVWQRFAALPPGGEAFAEGAKKVLKEIENNKDPKKAVNRLVREAFAARPPESMLDVVKLYDQLFHSALEQWTAAIAENKELKQLADADAEQLRQVLFGAESPAAIADKDIEGLFDRKARDGLRKLESSIEALRVTSAGAPPRAMVMVDSEKPTQPFVFIRGNPGRRGKQVPRQFLEVVAGPERKPFEHGSGRMDLARAIIAPDNPLTSRVIVNRVWMHHFGVGLVRTPSDFGSRSDAPSHPELLDWLASTFMAEGWSMKNLHRQIVLSNVYQQASIDDAAKRAIDPENQWLWRMNSRRLEFEALRDSMLAVAGRLDTKLGGRPVDVASPPWSNRRTIYGKIDRQDMPGIYQIFDFASPDVSTGERPRTTVPQQALFVMNSPFAFEQARAIIAREEMRKLQDPDARLNVLFGTVLGRKPTLDDRRAAKAFLAEAKNLSSQKPMWQYGVGTVEDKQKKLTKFKPLEHWTGTRWQPSAELPDAHTNFGYLNIEAKGGNPSNRVEDASVIRWTAPTDVVVKIDGRLNHPSDKGDGVRARVFTSTGGQLGSWTVTHKKVTTKVDRVELKAGQWIDFVVDCRESPSYDSYEWTPTIELLDASNPHTWSAEGEFRGPRLKPWEALAQVLMLTNEFMFVD